VGPTLAVNGRVGGLSLSATPSCILAESIPLSDPMSIGVKIGFSEFAKKNDFV
jgi:hypothetical protein